MEIRLLNPLDAENYLDLRLEALQNNSEAFASSYEEEKDYSVENIKLGFNPKTRLPLVLLKMKNLLGYYFG